MGLRSLAGRTTADARELVLGLETEERVRSVDEWAVHSGT